MNQEPPLLAPKVCPKCNAANYAHVQICWLCHEPLHQNVESVNPYAASSNVRVVAQPIIAPVTSSGQSRVEVVFLWLFVAIVVLAVLVAIGLGAQDTGLLGLFLIVLVPSLAAAGVRALYSLAKGEAPRPSKMFMTFILSAMFTIMAGGLLVICSVIFFFLTCAQMLSGGGPR